MMTIHCDRSHRAETERCLDNFKKQILDALDRGENVTIHVQQEMVPDEMLGTDVVQDFLYVGWTFGASVGRYPRRELSRT